MTKPTAKAVEALRDEPEGCEKCQSDVCECPCEYGCDNGYYYGNELPGFDWAWHDENGVYPCPSCLGTNLQKKRVLW